MSLQLWRHSLPGQGEYSNPGPGVPGALEKLFSIRGPAVMTPFLKGKELCCCSAFAEIFAKWKRQRKISHWSLFDTSRKKVLVYRVDHRAEHVVNFTFKKISYK